MNNKYHNSKALNHLRDEIDEIDDKILDLLMRRAAVAVKVSEVKKLSAHPGRFIRPAREAEVLRRLLEKHDGVFPETLIIRIWREIISATLALESEFSISVFKPDNQKTGLAYEWLARNYFGIDTKLTIARTTKDVLRSVKDGGVTVGVLPMPNDDDQFITDEEPWWIKLANEEHDHPMIIARLPWSFESHAVITGLEALSIACVEPEESGDDISYLALKVVKSVSQDKIFLALKKADLSISNVVVTKFSGLKGGPDWQLLQIEGFVSKGDIRLNSFLEYLDDEIEMLKVLGSYARPS